MKQQNEKTLKTPEEIFAHGVSPSMVNRWTRCRRSFYNHYFRGMKHEGTPNMVFGKALDGFWNGWYDVENPQRDLEVAKTKFREIFTKNHEIEKPRYSLTQKQGEQIIDMYAQVYPVDTEPFKVLQTQQDIEVMVKGLGVPLHVVLDGAIEYKNGIWSLENKTAGQNIKGKYNLDFQPVCQIKALETQRKEKVEGVLYNEVFLYKQIARKNFHRLELTKTTEQVEFLWNSYCQIAEEMLEYCYRHWDDVKMFPLSVGQMNCGYCEFREVCEFNDNLNLWRGE